MKTQCPKCSKLVDTVRGKKIAPHKDGNMRCTGSGKRVSENTKSKVGN